MKGTLFGTVEDALHIAQFLLEPMHGQSFVGEGGTHAVLAEAVGMDVQLAQHLEHWRKNQSVALEFDDDQGSHVAIDACLHIMKLQRGVDGEALGLGLVDQGDTTKIIVHVGYQRVDIEAQVMGQEFSFTIVG